MTAYNQRLSHSTWRAIGVAGIAFLLTAIIGCVHIVRILASFAGNPERAPMSVVSEGKLHMLEQWSYLSVATFLSTLFFAAAFEYAHRAEKRWISGLLVPTSIVILFFAGAVAYVPYSKDLEQGWMVNLDYAPRVSVLTGSAALLFGVIWRRRSSNRRSTGNSEH